MFSVSFSMDPLVLIVIPCDSNETCFGPSFATPVAAQRPAGILDNWWHTALGQRCPSPAQRDQVAVVPPMAFVAKMDTCLIRGVP